MNYYEELGIPYRAASDEVRRAYRDMARLLHPDQQSDEKLRRLAGIQMARLNLILETLTDTKARARYDDSLRRQVSEPAWERAYDVGGGMPDAPLGHRLRWGRLAWPAAGVVGIVLITLFLVEDAVVQRTASNGEASTPAALVGQEMESGAWPVRLEGRHAVSGGRANRDRTDGQKAGDFEGQWYYPKPAKLADPDGMCPPVYIDVEISQFKEQVKGKYSARYLVGGRPISPFVEFEFAGAVHEPAADLQWSGAGGAAGKVRLTLLSARSLRLEWSADEVGEELGLASGTATLVRRGSP
jgi:curved DNA-binding protein CbpA